MGYSPGLLLKIGQFSKLANSPEIDTDSPARYQKSIFMHLGGVSGSLARFARLTKIGPVQNHGLQPRPFAQNRSIFAPRQFTPNRHRQSRKVLEIHFQALRRRFREVGAISRTCHSRPCSKSWAITQGFCSKSLNFRPSPIHPKSTQIVLQGIRNPFSSTWTAFQGVWSDLQDLPKFALFKTMGNSPGLLLKIAQFSTLANSPQIDTDSPARYQKSIFKPSGGVSGSLARFAKLAKIGPVQNHGLQPRPLAQNRSIFDPRQFTPNRHRQSLKVLEIHFQVLRRRFREFGAICKTCQNPPCSKPWAIAQAFCSKSLNFRPSPIHPKSTQIVPQAIRNPFSSPQAAFQGVWRDLQDFPKSPLFKTMGYSPGLLLKIGKFSTLANSPQIDTDSPARYQKSIFKPLGGASGSLERFARLAKIRPVQNHGLQPRPFAQNRSIFAPRQFTPNRHRQSRKLLEIHFQALRRRFREFCAICKTFQNRPCSKPWAIAQAFCSKSVNFRPSPIHPKSTQIVPQGIRNPFPSPQAALQGVWSDLQDLPKSALFKTIGYSPGLLLKIAQFSTLANSPQIDTDSPARYQKSILGTQAAFQGVWSDLKDLPKSALFKTMGYSPGLLLKIAQFSTLANSPRIDTDSPARYQKSIFKPLGGVSGSLERFARLAKIGPVQNHGLQPRPFAQNRSIFDPRQFTPNRHRQSRKVLEIHFHALRRRFREFGAICKTCQNRPCSKPWAIAQAFCSKSLNFRPSPIHPKSTQIVLQGIRNPFSSTQAAFQGVLRDLQDLPKSALFKTMGYSPGLLLKIAQFSTLANSPQIDTDSPARYQKSIFKHLGGVSGSFARFARLAKIGPVQNHGLQPRAFAQNRSIFDPRQFTPNRHRQSRKVLEIHFQALRRRFREFGAICKACKNRPCSKPWAIAQAFCSKSLNFRPSPIHPKSTQIVPQGIRNPFSSTQAALQGVWSDLKDLPKSAMFKTMGYSPGLLLKIAQFSTLANSPQIDTDSPARYQKSIFKPLGGVSGSLERFARLAKIGPVQNHGLQPRPFAQNRSIFDPRQFTPNRHRQSRKVLEIHFHALRRRFREFGAICKTCQNRPCSKPWAIAQAFCSKSLNFRPSPIHPKSTQIVLQGIRNPFSSTQAAFQGVLRDLQDLPKSALFKTMGYSPGLLLKIAQFSTLANSPQIDTDSPARYQKSIFKHLGGVSGSFARFARLAKIGPVQNHGLQPRAFAQNRSIFDPRQFTPNRHRQSRKVLEIHFQALRRRFREFGAICKACKNRPCSKPWAIAQAFCSKSLNFRPSPIHPKSTQIVPQGITNPFSSTQAALQGVWSDLKDLPKSALFKTMGYSPGLLLKIGQFSPLANSPQIDTDSPASYQKSIFKPLGGVSGSSARFARLSKIAPVQKHGLQPRPFAQNR